MPDATLRPHRPWLKVAGRWRGETSGSGPSGRDNDIQWPGTLCLGRLGYVPAPSSWRSGERRYGDSKRVDSTLDRRRETNMAPARQVRRLREASLQHHVALRSRRDSHTCRLRCWKRLILIATSFRAGRLCRILTETLPVVPRSRPLALREQLLESGDACGRFRTLRAGPAAGLVFVSPHSSRMETPTRHPSTNIHPAFSPGKQLGREQRRLSPPERVATFLCRLQNGWNGRQMPVNFLFLATRQCRSPYRLHSCNRTYPEGERWCGACPGNDRWQSQSIPQLRSGRP